MVSDPIFSHLCYALGRLPQVLEYAERAAVLDPCNSICYIYIALSLNALDRLVEAEQAFRKALELSPDAPGMRAGLALALERLGRHDEALVEANCEPTDFVRWRTLGILHFRGGNLAESDRALNALIERFGDDAGFNIAINFAVRGDVDRAFEWLERGNTQHDSGMAYVKCNWMLRPLQADPRWPVFMKKMGFDE